MNSRLRTWRKSGDTRASWLNDGRAGPMRRSARIKHCQVDGPAVQSSGQGSSGSLDGFRLTAAGSFSGLYAAFSHRRNRVG
jgi:hypothetical protein